MITSIIFSLVCIDILHSRLIDKFVRDLHKADMGQRKYCLESTVFASNISVTSHVSVIYPLWFVNLSDIITVSIMNFKNIDNLKIAL